LVVLPCGEGCLWIDGVCRIVRIQITDLIMDIPLPGFVSPTHA